MTALTHSDKKRIFEECNKGKNFMTPHVIGFYGNSNMIAEVSRGEGFTHNTIYGVSFVECIDGEWKKCLGMGSCVEDLEQAKSIARETCKVGMKRFDGEGNRI